MILHHYTSLHGFAPGGWQGWLLGSATDLCFWVLIQPLLRQWIDEWKENQ